MDRFEIHTRVVAGPVPVTPTLSLSPASEEGREEQDDRGGRGKPGHDMHMSESI
jgi:hypothetical protein